MVIIDIMYNTNDYFLYAISCIHGKNDKCPVNKSILKRSAIQPDNYVVGWKVKQIQQPRLTTMQ